MDRKENQTESAADKTMTNGKAPYSPPRLTSYGDIRELTQTVGGVGAFDTADTTIGNNKTR